MPLNGRFHAALGEDFVGIDLPDQQFLQLLLQAAPGVRHVVELGTAYGVTALLLGLMMACRRGSLDTYDKADYRIPGVMTGWLPNMEFHLHDLLADPAPVREMVQAPLGACLLFCDNGDKPTELGLFADALRPGDVLLVHDWSEVEGHGEIDRTRCPPALSAAPWTRMGWSEAKALGSTLRAWARLR